jgi:hypothetical protein
MHLNYINQRECYGVGDGTSMGEMKSAYNILVDKTEGQNHVKSEDHKI